MRYLIEDDGTLTPITNNQLTPNFNANEFDERNRFGLKSAGNLYLSRSLLNLLQRVRIIHNKPISISSAYRSDEYQKRIQSTNKNAVSNSPHPFGLAVDIAIGTKKNGDQLVKLLVQEAKEINLPIRLLYAHYKHSFIHIDVCPFFFQPGRAWHNKPCPINNRKAHPAHLREFVN